MGFGGLKSNNKIGYELLVKIKYNSLKLKTYKKGSSLWYWDKLIIDYSCHSSCITTLLANFVIIGKPMHFQ